MNYEGLVGQTLNSVYDEKNDEATNHVEVMAALKGIKAQLRIWEQAFPG